MSCPTAAFVEKNYTQDLSENFGDKSLIKVHSLLLRKAAIGEGFDLEPGLNHGT
jgi:hypothetical protein